MKLEVSDADVMYIVVHVCTCVVVLTPWIA